MLEAVREQFVLPVPGFYQLPDVIKHLLPDFSGIPHPPCADKTRGEENKHSNGSKSLNDLSLSVNVGSDVSSANVDVDSLSDDGLFNAWSSPTADVRQSHAGSGNNMSQLLNFRLILCSKLLRKIYECLSAGRPQSLSSDPQTPRANRSRTANNRNHAPSGSTRAEGETDAFQWSARPLRSDCFCGKSC